VPELTGRRVSLVGRSAGRCLENARERGVAIGVNSSPHLATHDLEYALGRHALAVWA